MVKNIDIKSEDKITTIAVRQSTKKRLREYEKYSRETDDQVLVRILNKLDRDTEIK